MNSIGQSVFELESGNENVDRQTDGRRTHNRRVVCKIKCLIPKVKGKDKICSKDS